MMSFYQKQLIDFKENYMLYASLFIIFQSCLGSIAAMFVLMNATADAFPYFQLGLCVVVTMAFNASIMAQLSHKLVFNLLLVSVIINAILAAVNIAMLM